MDTQRFELLLRDTPFCSALLAEVWDGLSTMERIDLLLHSVESRLSLSKELKAKALADPSPVIRMLAVKSTYLSEQNDPDVYAKLQADESPFVRASLQLQASRGFVSFKAEDLLPLSHVEKLGVIALGDWIGGESLAKFVTDALANQAISEYEAGELVVEFVRNPVVIRHIEYPQRLTPEGGQASYQDAKGFWAMWNLTTCTPLQVHYVLAWEFPLTTGILGRATIPDEMLDRMSYEALRALAFRQHKPLLERLQEMPDRFDWDIHDAASHGEEESWLDEGQKRSARTDIDELHYGKVDSLHEEFHAFRSELREEFRKFHSDMHNCLKLLDGLVEEFSESHKEYSTFRSTLSKRLEDLTQQVAQAASRRRGLFG